MYQEMLRFLPTLVGGGWPTPLVKLYWQSLTLLVCCFCACQIPLHWMGLLLTLMMLLLWCQIHCTTHRDSSFVANSLHQIAVLPLPLSAVLPFLLSAWVEPWIFFARFVIVFFLHITQWMQLNPREWLKATRKTCMHLRMRNVAEL